MRLTNNNEYFELGEFDCPCCGQRVIDKQLVEMLNNARHLYGNPIVINSGFRCADHNIKVGGVPTSSHRRGLAVDIHCVSSRDRLHLLRCLLAVGFKRVGIRKDFIHVDTDPTKPEALWLY